MENICIITCHGFTGYPAEMEPLGNYLFEKGFTWHNLKIPGHDTTPEDLRIKKWTDWTDYVSKEIKIKLKEYPDGVFFSGLSMGGILTLWALENFPELKGGITLSTPVEILNWYQRFMTRLPLPGWWVKRSETDLRDINDDKEKIKHKAYTTFHTDSVKELHKLIKNMSSNLAKITQPILIIHSKKDFLIPVKNSDKIFKRVGSTIKEKFIVNNSGHVLTRDLDRVIIFDKINQFIKSIN